MRWNLDDVPIFAAVVEHKSFTAAAHHLGLSKSTVSKALARLEDALGVRLIDRNSRSMRITGEGEAFHAQARRILEQAREANAVMAGLTASPGGSLTVALPMAFCREIVAPRLPGFLARYPAIALEIVLTGQPVDLLRDQIDIAVVVGAQPESELMVRTLHEGRLLWVTSPGYARDTPMGSSLDDLRRHIVICEKRYAMSRFHLRDGGRKTHLDLDRGISHVNDPLTVREAVINGAGISPLPSQYCRDPFQRGLLIPVFEHIKIDISASALSVVYPSRRLISNKTRAFLDFLYEICAEL